MLAVCAVRKKARHNHGLSRLRLVRNGAAIGLTAVVLALGFTQSARASMMAPDVALWREDPQYQPVLDLVNWTSAPANAEITFFGASGTVIGTKHFALDPG